MAKVAIALNTDTKEVVMMVDGELVDFDTVSLYCDKGDESRGMSPYKVFSFGTRSEKDGMTVVKNITMDMSEDDKEYAARMGESVANIVGRLDNPSAIKDAKGFVVTDSDTAKVSRDISNFLSK